MDSRMSRLKQIKAQQKQVRTPKKEHKNTAHALNAVTASRTVMAKVRGMASSINMGPLRRLA